jgi:hypothetical protein
VNTAHGAERYIKSGRSIYLDGKKTSSFPIRIDIEKAIFHKIVVAHGAKEACISSSTENIYGSLGITYTDMLKERATESIGPFSLLLDKSDPIHILDSHNLPIILGELDTVSDFANYLDEKTKSIKKLKVLSYCGEEDLLAHYYANFDEKNQRHFIGSDDEEINGVIVSEGEWKGFIETETYIETKRANKASYLWDKLIQKTCQYSIDGKLLGDADILRSPNAIYEMVKEPRFMRRELAEGMIRAIDRFPQTDKSFRHVTLMPSITPTTAYVFLQVQLTDSIKTEPDARAKRQAILEIACGSAKNEYPKFTKIIGIGMEPPKYSETVSEDFILMPCESWTSDQKAHYESLNENLNFFRTSAMTKREIITSEFIQSSNIPKSARIGRNEPCSCGSQKKYKKCCGA